MSTASPTDILPQVSEPEFIYAITRQIWVDPGSGGKLNACYVQDIPWRAPTGFTGGNLDGVLQNLQTLHQFSDQQTDAEDGVW